MPAFNTRNYAWKDCEIRLAGKLLTSVDGVSWTTKQAKEAIFGKGVNALAIKKGNITVEGSITLLQDELEQLLDFSADQSALSLENLDLQVAFEDDGVMVRYSIIGVSFTEEPHDIKQGDMVSRSALPFLALAAIRQG